MKIMGKGKLAHPVVRYLFLLSFWAVWLALPFIMIDDDDTQHRDLFIKILPASFTNVILFFIIAEWLGPRLLSQQRLKTYLLTGLVVSLLFIAGKGFM